MDLASHSGSGELGDMLGKRKQQPAAAAPRGPTHRASCGPTCSSPALGRSLLEGHNSGSCCAMERDSCEATCESVRGKAQRVCCPGAQGAAAPGAQPRRIPATGSMPPALYHSLHTGCCSRMSSSSSLADAECAAAAAGMAAAAAAAEAGVDLAAFAVPAVPDAATAARSGSCSMDAEAAPAAAVGDGWPLPLCTRQASVPVEEAMEEDVEEAEAAGEPEGQRLAASVWSDVPDDVLKKVLEWLPASQLRVLRLVCRGWEAGVARLLRHLRPEAVAGKQLGRRFPALHSLDLSNCCMGVDFASPRMLRLQSLLNNGHLAELAGLGRLEHLSLRGCSRLTGRGLSLLSCLPSLRSINLSCCTSLTDDCMACLAAALPQLATVNLQGCSRLGDAGIARLAALPRLRHLLLPAGITDASMPSLVLMPALERVALRGCPHVTTSGVHLLLQRSGLRHIVVSKCRQVSVESLCGEVSFKVVTDPGGAAPAAPAPDAAPAAAPAVHVAAADLVPVMLDF